MINEKRLSSQYDKNFNYLILTIVIGILSFTILDIYDGFNIVFERDLFLTIHGLLELISALIAFSIFTALYNIYDFSNRLRNIVIANVFLIVGMFDIFHLMSYKGMPLFFTENISQKATAYWIFARIIMSSGILISWIIPREFKAKMNKKVFLFISLGAMLILGYLIAYDSFIIPTLITNNGLTSTKIALEYVVIFLLGLSIIVIGKDYLQTKKSNDIVFMSALVLSIFSELVFTMYNNVYDSYNLLGHIFKIISFILIFKVLFIETIKGPYIKVNKMKTELKKYVDKLELMVKQKTQQMTNTNKKLSEVNKQMNKELDAAKQIQTALLPNNKEVHSGVEFHSNFIPCGKLSGDFFKFFKIDENNTGMFLIDVSGHGVSSSLLTIFAERELIPTDEDDLSSRLNPKEVLKDFYDTFNESDFPDETHMVMVYGVYNNKTRELTYSMAGHNCTPLLIKSDKTVHPVDHNKGFPICKLGDLVDPEFENQTIKLDSGDKILFYTDGVTELKNESEEFYGFDRLTNTMSNKSHISSENILNEVIGDLMRFKGAAEIEDDITMFIMDSK